MGTQQQATPAVIAPLLQVRNLQVDIAAVDQLRSVVRAVSFSVQPGACAEVIAAIDAGGQGVDLRIVDGTSGESSLVRGAHVASDRLCAGGAAKPAKAELRLSSGKADALVLVRPFTP